MIKSAAKDGDGKVDTKKRISDKKVSWLSPQVEK